MPDSMTNGGGTEILRRGIAGARVSTLENWARGNREETEGFKTMETGKQMRALNTRNHGEKSRMHGRQFPKGKTMMTSWMTSSIFFSFSFSFIPVKSFI